MNKKILLLLNLSLLLATCNNKEIKKEVEKEAIKVTVFKVKGSGQFEQIHYSGTIEAFRVIPLSFQVTGTIQEVRVKEGDFVRKGEILATLDPIDYQQLYNASLAKYLQAKDAYERLKNVYEQGSLSEIKWIEITTNLEQAKSSLELSRNNLNKTRLIAPEEGYIGRRNIEPGQTSVVINSAPIELVKIEKVNIKISVPENEINRIKVGQEAFFFS